MRYLIIILIFLTGCYTAKKASKQIAKVHVLHPELLARYCADNYPIHAKSDTIELPPDSTGYLDAIAELNHVINDMNGIQDSLIAALALDTACGQYEAQISDLRKRLLSVKPERLPPIIKTVVIRDTVVDKADLAVQTRRADQLQGTLDVQVRVAAAAQNKAAKWQRYAIVTWLLLTLIIGLYIYIRYKKKTKIL